MAAAPSDTIPLYPRHKRFVKGNGWELHSFCLSPDGKVIASGFHYNGKTYIDVYSSSRDKPTIVYSRESKKYSDRPYQLVSCHDSNSSVVICCVSDKLEVLELKVPTSNILKSLTVDGQIRSVAVMDGETFLSISRSTKVYVFDRNFEQTKQIKLEGIEKEEYPCDMAVVKDRIFVITIVRGFGNRALSYGKSGGNILTEFHNTIRQRTYAQSIAVSVKSGLVLVLWNWDQIIAYPFSENKPLLVFDLRNNIRRIRISEAGYLVCGSIVGEIRLYYLEQLFSFEAMKQTLAYIVSSEECEKLRKYFRVTEEEIKRLETGDEDKELSDEEKTVRKMECLLTVIEKKGYLNPYDVNKLTDAVSKLGDKKRNSDLKGPIKGYSLHSKNIKIIMTKMMTRQKAWEDERNQLNDSLEAAESKVKEHAETLKGIQYQLVQAREQETRLKKDLKDGEHKITVLEEEKMTSAEGLQQIKTLTQELKQTDESKTESDRQIETLTEELKQDHEKTLDDLQDQLVQAQAQRQMLRQDLTIAELKIKEMQEVEQQSSKQIETLTMELEQIQMKSAKERETLTVELNQTKQSKAGSDRQIEALAVELKQTKQSKEESDRQIERLTEKLKQTNQSNAVAKEEQTQRPVEDKTLVDSEETRDKDGATLAELHKRESAQPIMTERMMAKVEEKTFNKAFKRDTNDRSFEEPNSDLKKRIEVLQEHLQDSKRPIASLEKVNIDSTNVITEREILANQNILERDSALSKLHQYQLNSTKEIRELKEYVSQLKDTIVHLKQGPAGMVAEDDSSIILLKDTTDPALSAEYERMIVGSADFLTLDHSLKLSLLFNLPPSFGDVLLRISLFESPGLKFLQEIKDRNIINMYDTTNLQKALKMLELDKVNFELVTPYQAKVDDEQYALHKAKDRFTWEEVNTFLDATKSNKKVFRSNESIEDAHGSRHGEQLKQEPPAELTTNYSGIKETSAGLTVKDRQRSPYIEHSIGKEGGTIHLANITLTIPSEALLRTEVIGLSVSTDPYFCLPTEFDKTRMTPLVKLEPLGLTLKKPVQLVIPHFALIPEPERHDVMIYSGLTSANRDQISDITWTEEKSIPRQLKEKSVIVDIQCLSYLCACLVSQPTAPSWHIVRALTFIDGVRSPDEDITLTVCFCSDNESEYNTLLSDYRKKLFIEKYLTLYLPRYSELTGKDNTLNVTVTSVNNTYMSYTDQAATKSIAFPHLCSASRVSQQFRLKKNHTSVSDLVDVKLIFSQKDSTEMFLKAKIKDLIISQESEDRLKECVPPDLKPYEKLKAKVSAMLDKDHCGKLAHYFELSPAEARSVEKDPSPGLLLIKILDQREKIMPQKMIDLFQGLKACHLDKISRRVSKYIDKHAKHTQQELQRTKKESKDKEIRTDDSLLMHSSRKQQVSLKSNDPLQVIRSSPSNRPEDLTIFSNSRTSDAHAKTLMKEGHPEHDELKALEVSTNRLALFSKLLRYINEPLVMLQEKESLLYKEQYIDKQGGEIHLPEGKIRVQIPNGSIFQGSIVSIMILTGRYAKIAFDGRAAQLTPVIKIGPESLSLYEPVTITIPHCAAETGGIIDTNMYLGFSTEGEDIQWKKRNQQQPRPLLKKDSFEVLAYRFSAISLNVAVNDVRPLCKRMRILPLISRVLNASDDLTITLLVYNDDEAEHLHIVYEQTGIEGKIQLHDFKRFTLKSSDKDKEVHIKSGNVKITPYINTVDTKKILVNTLLQNTRHSLEFHFQNKEQINDFSFKVEFRTRHSVGTDDDLQFDFNITLAELLKKPTGSTGLLKSQFIQPETEKSFQTLVHELGREIGKVSSLEIARFFGLPTVVRGRIEGSNEPGHVLLGELIHKQLISSYHVSSLDLALTKTGEQQLAGAVKKYRKENVSVSTTIFTLL